MDLPNSILKHLRPLGHELALWRQAISLLHTRLVKGRLPGELADFVREWLPTGEPPAPLPDRFEVLLGEGADGRPWLQSASIPFAANPAWWALLQMPALKSRWEADLRASHYQHLLTVLPRAWTMDPTPLPPGGVIPHLEVGRWPSQDELGTSFSLYHLDGSPAATQSAGKIVLAETRASLRQWQAHYVSDLRGVRLHSAVLL